MDKPMLQQFLKAGYVYEKQLFPTERGTPQGGLISPILANAALNGIEPVLKNRYKKTIRYKNGQREYENPKVNMVRYADDFVITAATREIAEKLKELVRGYLAERGLQLSEEKTLITHIGEGFDFLGWNFRKYNGKLLIKPSKKSQQKVVQKIREIIHSHRSATQDELIRILNPIIEGWSSYHQGTVATKVFKLIDCYIFRMLWRWARRRHPKKSRHWIKSRYWKTTGNDHWRFMDTLTLKKMIDKKIVRHIPLKLDMNPYIDRDYFYYRRLKLLANKMPVGKPETKPNPKTGTGREPETPCLFEA
jgi:RNA-directed DNA polymerase